MKATPGCTYSALPICGHTSMSFREELWSGLSKWRWIMVKCIVVFRRIIRYPSNLLLELFLSICNFWYNSAVRIHSGQTRTKHWHHQELHSLKNPATNLYLSGRFFLLDKKKAVPYIYKILEFTVRLRHICSITWHLTKHIWRKKTVMSTVQAGLLLLHFCNYWQREYYYYKVLSMISFL